MKVRLLIFGAVLILLAAFVGMQMTGSQDADDSDRDERVGGQAAAGGLTTESGSPRNASKTVRERVREAAGKKPPHPVEWAIVEHLLESYEDPDSLVFTKAEQIGEDPYPRWEFRVVANQEGFERITALVRSGDGAELLDALQEQAGGEAFAPENRPKIQFVSFRLDRRRPGDPGSDAPDETGFRRIPVFGLRVIPRSDGVVP